MNQVYTFTNDKPPKEQLRELTEVVSKFDIINFAQSIGITWKPVDNPNINWMRCSMAIQNNFDTFKESWNNSAESEYSEEISAELVPTIEYEIAKDKSPEYLYCSGDFQPKELLTSHLKANYSIGECFSFLFENVQIEQILEENSSHQYLFSYKDKIVFMNDLEMENCFLIEQFIKRGFEKTYLSNSKRGSGNPIKFWLSNQYSLEERLRCYYLDTILVYKNDNYQMSFTKTSHGWRYLSYNGKLYWFTNHEMAYIDSKFKLIQKRFP